METGAPVLYETWGEALLSWGTYLAYADILRERFEDTLELADDEEDSELILRVTGSPERSSRLIKDAACSYYYASLLPVIEGWKELRLWNAAIAELLDHQDDFYSSMQRHRNSVFHYQKQLLNRKRREIFEKGDQAVIWIVLLHAEFSRFFRDLVDAYPGSPEQKNEFRALAQEIVGWLPRTAEDFARESAAVTGYFDAELQRSDLSADMRQAAIEITANAEQLPRIAKVCFSDLEKLRAAWRASLFEAELGH